MEIYFLLINRTHTHTHTHIYIVPLLWVLSPHSSSCFINSVLWSQAFATFFTCWKQKYLIAFFHVVLALFLKMMLLSSHMILSYPLGYSLLYEVDFSNFQSWFLFDFKDCPSFFFLSIIKHGGLLQLDTLAAL